MRTFLSPAGVTWGVEVVVPASSNAMVMFRHPNAEGASLDRYNWFIARWPEAHTVSSRLSIDRVLESLSDTDLGRLFHRSMPITNPRPRVNLASGMGGSTP